MRLLAALLSVALAGTVSAKDPHQIDKALIAAAGKGDTKRVTELLAHGANSNVKPPEGESNALERAIQENHPDVVRLLVQHGANLRPEGIPILGLAADKAHESIARLLIERGLSINEKYSDGDTILLGKFRYPLQDIQVEDIEFLLDLGADPNQANNDGVTPLMRFAEATVSSNDRSEAAKIPALLELLVRRGARLNDQDNDGDTALMHAINEGDIVAVQFLTEAKADLNIRNKKQDSALLRALRFIGDHGAAYLITHGADVSVTDKDGDTTLMWAASGQQLTVARTLLDRGIDPKAQSKDGQTAAHFAASIYNAEAPYIPWYNDANDRRDAIAMLKLLSDAGEDLTVADNAGQTPLHQCMRLGYVGTATFLIEKGCDLNARNKKGETPLLQSITAEVDALPKTRLLISKGADVNLADANGQTPLMIAAINMAGAQADYLVMHGADVNRVDNQGAATLMLAVSAFRDRAIRSEDYGHIIRLLSDRAKAVNISDSKRITPLMWASASNVPEAIEALLAYNADVTARSTDGRTPLMWAASCNADAVIPLLLAHGADPSARDNNGRTALDWAKWMNQPIARQAAIWQTNKGR